MLRNHAYFDIFDRVEHAFVRSLYLFSILNFNQNSEKILTNKSMSSVTITIMYIVLYCKYIFKKNRSNEKKREFTCCFQHY